MDLSVVPYKHTTTTPKPDHNINNESEYGDVVEPKPLDKNLNPLSDVHVKYGECMRNHAASIGGHANDGCGEFMPRADDGSRNSLSCAACGCHRNFHRRELPGADHLNQLHFHVHSPPPMLMYNAGPTPPRWDPKMVIGSHRNHPPLHRLRSNGGRLMEPRDDDDHHDDDGAERDYDRRSETPEREVMHVQVGPCNPMVGMRTSSCKRSRTKFTQEQKDRMLAFAESIGWRIQRHDDVALNQFCSEVGVKRNVLKVWMHNNKNALRRRESNPPSTIVPEALLPPAPPQPAGI